jgi:hypothetical protein
VLETQGKAMPAISLPFSRSRVARPPYKRPTFALGSPALAGFILFDFDGVEEWVFF